MKEGYGNCPHLESASQMACKKAINLLRRLVTEMEVEK